MVGAVTEVIRVEPELLIPKPLAFIKKLNRQMIKFFRKIRQKMLIENNFKKYLIYALGEILLVMVGISLAFQVSNWDNNRIKKNAEIRFYENTKEQIRDDKELIQSQMEFNNHFMSQFKYANEIIEGNDRSKIDTLGQIVRNLSQYSDFDKQGNIYETMVNSGQINLLRNHKIVNGIRELEERYIYINRMENIHYDAMMNHVLPVINPVLKYSTGEIIKPDSVFTYQFQNLVIILIQVMNEKDRIYKQAINEIELVSKIIDEELNAN